MRRRVDQQQLGVLDRVDEVLRRRARSSGWLESASHHVSGRELDDVLLALRVDHEIPQAAHRDERGVAGDIAAPLQELAGGQAP